MWRWLVQPGKLIHGMHQCRTQSFCGTAFRTASFSREIVHLEQNYPTGIDHCSLFHQISLQQIFASLPIHANCKSLLFTLIRIPWYISFCSVCYNFDTWLEWQNDLCDKERCADAMEKWFNSTTRWWKLTSEEISDFELANVGRQIANKHLLVVWIAGSLWSLVLPSGAIIRSNLVCISKSSISV